MGTAASITCVGNGTVRRSRPDRRIGEHVRSTLYTGHGSHCGAIVGTNYVQSGLKTFGRSLRRSKTAQVTKLGSNLPYTGRVLRSFSAQVIGIGHNPSSALSCTKEKLST